MTDPHDNQLLAALSDDVLERWLPQLEPVELPLGMVLYESGARQRHLYFPTTAIAGKVFVLQSGATTEMAVVGRDGVVGTSLFMGGESAPCRAIVQCAGQAFRLRADAARQEFDKMGEAMHLLLRYTQALFTQVAQTAVCNRHHCVNQQLCRWLLLSLDRSPGRHLAMTQELIANLLGVRREGITAAALILQAAGLISYARGHITVLDRHGLERRSCECYDVVRKEYDRLLPLRERVHAERRPAFA